MIALGKWYSRVPKDPEGNRRFRLRTLRRCRVDLPFRAAIMQACAADIFFWIDLFVWQYNPKRTGTEVEPFILWEFQREALLRTARRLFEDQRRVLWEKSRELGATWLALILFDHECLFDRWKSFFCISHSEDAVQKAGKRNTLFAKLDFIHEFLPDWMLRGVVRRKLSYEFPATNSTIEGGATTERSGVGGRNTAVLMDEFAKHTKDFEILGQTADTGPCLIISTHYGTGTAFHKLAIGSGFKIVMHWSQHPEKRKGLYRCSTETGQIEVLDKQFEYPVDFRFVNDGSPTGGPFPGVRSPWYDAECEERANPRDVAMHLDIDAKGSVTQFFDAMTIHRLRGRAWPAVWVGDVEYDRDTGLVKKLVKREGGCLRLWLDPGEDGSAIPYGTYTCGSDVAEGTGATPSCLSFVNGKTGEKVGEYANAHIRSEPFAALAVGLCRLFRDEGGQGAHLVWEKQGPGATFGLRVIELGYRRIYYRTDQFGGWQATVSEKPGWYPSPDTKRVLLESYREALSRGEFSNPSDNALSQCLDFRYDKEGNPEHPGEKNTEDTSAGRVNHGDMVIADALSWMVAKEYASIVVKKKQDEVPFMSYAWRRRERQRQAREDEISEVWEE